MADELTAGGMPDELTARVRALERAVSDQSDPPAPIPDVASVSTDVADLTARLDRLETSIDDLVARQQAIEAYADHINHVDDTIKRRADAALAAVDRLETTVDRLDTTIETLVGPDSPGVGDSGSLASDDTPPNNTTSAEHLSYAASTVPDAVHVARRGHAADAPHGAGDDPPDESHRGEGSGLLTRLLGR